MELVGRGLNRTCDDRLSLCTYTFVQGGRVRVDLAIPPLAPRQAHHYIGSMVLWCRRRSRLDVVAGISWRHLVVPNPSASDGLERLLNKARAVR
jgi:hypothetical protein